MLTKLLFAALVWGPSDCPAPADVDAVLSRDVGRQLVVEVTRVRDGVRLEARNLAGEPLALHVLPAQGDCAALAEAVSAVIAAWAQDGLTPRRAARSETLRAPLKAVVEAHAPLTLAPAPPPSRSHELALSVGAAAVPGAPPRSFTATAELSRALPGGGLLLSSLAVTAPVSVVFARHNVELRSLQVALSGGFGARAVFAGFALDLFVGAPLSLVAPLDTHAEPLSLPQAPSLLLSGLAGVRLTARELRFAPFLRLAVEIPVVSFPERVVAPVTGSLSFGIAWGAS